MPGPRNPHRAQLLQEEENRLTLSQSLVAEAISLYLQIQSLERRIQITLQSLKNYRTASHSWSALQKGIDQHPGFETGPADPEPGKGESAATQAGTGYGTAGPCGDTGGISENPKPYPQPEDYYKKLKSHPARAAQRTAAAQAGYSGSGGAAEVVECSDRCGQSQSFPEHQPDRQLRLCQRRTVQPLSSRGIWSLAAGLAQPLFDAGRLKANQRAAEARYSQGLAAIEKRFWRLSERWKTPF
jgi:hypothetical protein